jgi:uncharacterized protein YndB with AHSA1/START domain
MSDPVIAEVEVAAPAGTVWRALREPAEIRRWFGWDYEGLDEEIRQIFVDGAKADDAGRVLDFGEGGAIALEERGDRTVVRVTRAAPTGVYDEINEGWMTFVQQLRFYLERHAGQDRVTEHVPADDGAEWFSSPHQRGVVREDGALVIRTPTRTIVSRYD